MNDNWWFFIPAVFLDKIDDAGIVEKSHPCCLCRIGYDYT